MEEIDKSEVQAVLIKIPEIKRKEISRSIIQQLSGKGLTYRQAEMLLEYTKDLLKDTKF